MLIGLLPARLNLKRSKLSKKLDDLIVCTDYKKIIDLVNQHGGKAIMTSKKIKMVLKESMKWQKKFL